MLNRCLCTIYLAQESDTLGKDSELAATLAQGKPVIAYVPEVDIKQHEQELTSRPLDYFHKRISILRAEGLFDDTDFVTEIAAVADWKTVLEDFHDTLANHRRGQPFTLFKEKEAEFKVKFRDFDKLCTILATLESVSYNKRARTLSRTHPLSLQVDLKTGVANGVIVVRSARACTDVLYDLLTNGLNFTSRLVRFFELKPDDADSLLTFFEIHGLRDRFQYNSETKDLQQVRPLIPDELKMTEDNAASAPEEFRDQIGRFRILGVTVLEEKRTSSPYRVVTNDEKLTNSFWNFFRTTRERW